MPKIDMPIGLNGDLDYSDEAMKLSELMLNTDRTSTGQISYTSESSGITYNTADYPDNAQIYNKGDCGLIALLHIKYGGTDGWLLMANDINSKTAVEVVQW